ncbi:MAG: choice-of-anchor tandem repeat GloVer-containing protein [Candidatus Sulfotelmatobacter sp.]
MNIRVVRSFTLTLISLLSLLGFAAQAGAQGNVSKQLNVSPKLRGRTGNTHKAQVKAAGTASGYSVLYSFCSAPNCTDGEQPRAGLIQDAASNLYGTTAYGGANTAANGGYGGGTVFKLGSTGQETVLYSFCSATNCTDGSGALDGGLIQDAAANLYSTTTSGGADGLGTAFKLDDTGHETALYSFCSAANCADGAIPAAGLIQDASGNLYGTTNNGGNSTNDSSCPENPDLGCGTVFRVDSAGQETVLYSFCPAANCTDGDNPYGGLFQDSAGNLYGTAAFGGANTGAGPGGQGGWHGVRGG